MFGFDFGFDRPYYLLLLLLVPLLWIFSFRSLAGLGRFRRIVALTLRTLVFVLFILALSEIQFRKSSDKLTVIYLLDQSQSIPPHQRQSMLDYVRHEVDKHRNPRRGDQAGVIIFGREAMVEVPPFDDSINAVRLETLMHLRTDGTNLEGAFKLAQASFPEDTAKRIVVVTDGNENIGNAGSIARRLVEDGIGIDVVPIRLSARLEVAIEKVTLPSDIRRSQPFEVMVVANNYASESDVNEGVSRGKVRVSRALGKSEELIAEEDVALPPGKQVYRFQQKIDEPAVYTYKAVFIPSAPEDDVMTQNNEATTFVHIRGKGRVLFIEDSQQLGEFEFLVQSLREMNVEVEQRSTDQLFSSLAELQGYDTIVLANVPRSSGLAANDLVSFSDEQIQMLVRNTEQMGCGLVMIGGENSFGAGGWVNTELEKAMPVDFQIKNAKIQAVGALVMVMHASELAQGNYWQKVVGQNSVKSLGPLDYCGSIHWDDFAGRETWLWGGSKGIIRVGSQQKMMLSRLERMTPGDMPDFEPAMKMALAAFNRTPASVKHMIMISDGDPTPPGNKILSDFAAAKIQISTVAIGTHGPAGSTPLQTIARRTGGQYYVVTNPQALPKIYQREVRKIARPLIKVLEDVPPRIVSRHEMLQGIDEPLPPLKGFMMTTVKENPLVEVALRSPDPPDPENATILASWTYGLGRTLVFTPDAGKSWANAWTKWPNYDKFFSQMIRWSMRPVDGQGKFNVATHVRDGQVEVIVTAMDKDDEFLNFLPLTASKLSPDLQPEELKAEQVAPGRYVIKFNAEQSGSYFVTVNPGQGHPPLIAGVTVPYSAEFRDRETNRALLLNLVGMTPKGGQPGEMIDVPLQSAKPEDAFKVDTFRHNLAKAISSQNVWPLFALVAACLFFADVFVRRVSIGFEWLQPVRNWVQTKVLRKQQAPVEDARLQRLRSRKAAVSEKIDERRAASRFEPQVDPGKEKSLDEVLESGPGLPRERLLRPDASSLTPTEADEETYTARLLKAKQRARKDTGQPPWDPLESTCRHASLSIL